MAVRLPMLLNCANLILAQSHQSDTAPPTVSDCDDAGLGLGLGSGSRLSSRLGFGLGLVLGS